MKTNTHRPCRMEPTAASSALPLRLAAAVLLILHSPRTEVGWQNKTILPEENTFKIAIYN